MIPTLGALPQLNNLRSINAPFLEPVDSGGGDVTPGPIVTGGDVSGDTSSGGGGGSIPISTSSGGSSTTTSSSGSCSGIFSFINPLCSIERFAIFIIGLICIAGSIYLFKPTSQIIAGPVNAAKTAIKTAAEVAPAAA